MKLLKAISMLTLLLGISAMAQCKDKITLDVYPSSVGKVKKGAHSFIGVTAARDYIRTLKGGKRAANIDVVLHDGVYLLDQTLILGIKDGGVGNNFVTYKAANGENPILSSGQTVGKWSSVNTTLKGLPVKAKGKLWVTDFPRGVDSVRVLYDGNQRLLRARSKGFNHAAQKAKRFASRNVAQQKDRYLLKRMPFPKGLIQKGDRWEDIEFEFCPVPWAYNIIGIDSVDFEKSVAWLKYEANSAPFTTPKDHHPAFAENSIRFLDTPGEWVADHKARKIYYWPENKKPSGGEVVPTLTELVRVEGDIHYKKANDEPVKNIAFEGITFRYGNRYDWWKGHKGWGIQHDWDKFDCPNALLRFRGAEGCKVNHCRFIDSGNSAIRLDLHAQRIEIKNNLIQRVGHMGILLAGYGPGEKDVNKNNHIESNIIDHCGEVVFHGHAIFIWQSGENYVGHNVIQNCPRKAVGICGVRAPIFIEGESVDWDEASKTLRWKELDPKLRNRKNITQEALLPYLHARNNIVEFNDVYRTRVKIGDGASLNVSGAGTGNVMRNNMLVEVVGNGMRTDDWQRGTTFENNIIASGGVVHKGCNNLLNNLFINSTVRFTSYPGQVKFSGAKVSHNIFYFNGKGQVPYSGRKTSQFNTPYDICENSKNVFYNSLDKNIEVDFLKKMQAHPGFEKGTIVADPKFVHALPKYRRLLKEDVALMKSSPAYALGCKKIDVMGIGLADGYPKDLAKDVYARVERRLISENANIQSSSVGRSVKNYKQMLLAKGGEVDVESVISTNKEKNPFIVLDLGDEMKMDAFHLISSYKNGDNSNRKLALWTSVDGQKWTQLWKNDIEEIKVGRSWDIILDHTVKAKYVKVGLNGNGKLTMKQIQVYQDI
ncbi:right-handed parallel beta-helix repeat-containing protein [Halosquirtibacter xylanolyticus]|uniref:right-handed parallel beta-helix repeat-containing protein n=1 Tax=Halosquirtibacter xylanolyticus TaxID=3374599 RepID=UPI00374A5813|nr:right-handed parallel beta-helix repeat-containing protein [Prolixibacteraceae bacterium]